jgi:hypothetical protein
MVYVHCLSCYFEFISIGWLTNYWIKKWRNESVWLLLRCCVPFSSCGFPVGFPENRVLMRISYWHLHFPLRIYLQHKSRVQDSTGVSVPCVTLPITNCVTQLYWVIISVQNDRITCNWTAPVSRCYYCDWIHFNKTNMYISVNCM